MESFLLTDWLQQYFPGSARGPAYKRLYDLICKAILEGHLAPGSRLPSTRTLAAELGIARNTVLQVYSQLTEEGYADAGVGRGTFVLDISQDLISGPGGQAVDDRRNEPLPALSQALSRRAVTLLGQLGYSKLQSGAFMPGVPDVREFPLKIWMRIQNRVWRTGPWALMRYAPAGGYEPLRQTISDYLAGARSVRSSARQVVMTTGIHQAIDIALRLLCNPGDFIWVEEPAYWGVRNLVIAFGGRPVPIRVDDEGIWPRPDERHRAPKLIVVAPSHQYPLGMVMSLARRRMLLDYAHKNHCWIVEDDYDSEFRYNSRPLPSLQGLDEGARVIYAGSFSKTLYPGLRVGFLVAPPSLACAFADATAELYREGSMVTHAILNEFIEAGYLASHIRRVRRRYAERRTCLIEEIHKHFGDTLGIVGDAAGLHLVLALPKGTNDESIVRDALEETVVTRPLSTYYLGRERAKPGLLLGYASVTPEEIRPAFDALAAVIQKHLRGAGRLRGAEAVAAVIPAGRPASSTVVEQMK